MEEQFNKLPTIVSIMICSSCCALTIKTLHLQNRLNTDREKEREREREDYKTINDTVVPLGLTPLSLLMGGSRIRQWLNSYQLLWVVN